MENFREESFVLTDLIYRVNHKVEIYRVQNGAETIVVKKLYVKTPEEANSNLKEVFAMVSLNHPSIVKVRSGLIGKGFQYVLIVMDYYPDGDLEKEIKRRATIRQPWSEVELDSIFNSLISGYAYMQKEHKLAHLDIKPQNILKKGNQYFIAGLRCAFKSREGESDSIAGTPAYLSPSLSKAYSDYSKGFRVSNFKHNAYKSDVYSLGLTFFYMATLTPFDELRIQLGDQQFNIHVLNRIREMRYSETIKNKIASMVSFEEHLRPDFIALAGYSGGTNIQDKNTNYTITFQINLNPHGGLTNQIDRPYQILPAKNSEIQTEELKNSCKICGKNNQNLEILHWNNFKYHKQCFDETIKYYFEGNMCHYYLCFQDGSQQVIFTKLVGFCLQCRTSTYLKQSIYLFKCLECLKKVNLNFSSPPIDIFYKGIASQCKEIFDYINCMNQNECGKLAELKFNDHSICFDCFEKYFMPMFNYTNAQNPRLYCPNPSKTPNINSYCCFIDFSSIFIILSKNTYDIQEKHRKDEEIQQKLKQSVSSSSGDVSPIHYPDSPSQEITPIYLKNSSSNYLPAPGTVRSVQNSGNKQTINYHQKEEFK